MAEHGDSAREDGIDYAELLRSALVGLVRQVLARVAAEGLPGEHHLLLVFGTRDEGVVLPARLRAQNPDQMTIVLQHQFWGLEAGDDGFSVTLRFGGAPERLSVPWTALRAFVDPSVGFGLRLQPTSGAAQAATADGPPAPAAPQASGEGKGGGDEGKVVDFGAFRRRSDES